MRGPTLPQLESAAADGAIVEALETRPDRNLPEELIFILEQFLALSRVRPPAFSGLSYIPMSEVEAYWRIYLRDDGILALQDFADWITTLDEVMVQHFQEQDEREKKEKEKKP